LPKELIPRTKSEVIGNFNKENNSVMIESTNYVRIFEIDSNNQKLLWQYINKSKEYSTPLMISWSRHMKSLPRKFNELIINSCQKK